MQERAKDKQIKKVESKEAKTEQKNKYFYPKYGVIEATSQEEADKKVASLQNEK